MFQSAETSPTTTPPLEVDQFHHRLIIEPRNPVTYEMTLATGANDGELFVFGFEYELAKGAGTKHLDEYKAKPPATSPQDAEAVTGEADLLSRCTICGR